MGAQVRKGEDGGAGGSGDAGSAAGEDGADGHRPWVFARGYSVFNAAQADGYAAPALPALPERIGHAEAFFAALGADIRHGGSRSCCPALTYTEIAVNTLVGAASRFAAHAS